MGWPGSRHDEAEPCSIALPEADGGDHAELVEELVEKIRLADGW